jgi:GNAT superfamily N-acetyltransferase
VTPPVFRLVDGAAFATTASAILEEAWDPPVIRYSPEYLQWQLRFPASDALLAAAAFDDGEAVGFAAASERRIRWGFERTNVALVSFVAVRRNWRNQGIAAGLYRTLTSALSDRGLPVITFASPSSTGERTLLRSYRKARFSVQPLGDYPNYARLAGDTPADSDYEAVVTSDLFLLRPIVDECSRDLTVLWSDPNDAQVEHYAADPRGRRLVTVRHSTAGLVGAAWVIRMEHRTVTGSSVLKTLDCVWMRKDHVRALPALCRCAAEAGPNEQAGPGIIVAPNLSIFDPAILRTMGIRQTGAKFCGYFCAPSSSEESPPLVTRTNLEIV